jgi:hypothetical protein
MSTPGSLQGSESYRRWYEDYLGMLQKANDLTTENGRLLQQFVPFQQRIAALEGFVRFVARSRPGQDGSCSLCGEPTSLTGGPERHRSSCLIAQARVVLASI